MLCVEGPAETGLFPGHSQSRDFVTSRARHFLLGSPAVRGEIVLIPPRRKEMGRPGQGMGQSCPQPGDEQRLLGWVISGSRLTPSWSP